MCSHLASCVTRWSLTRWALCTTAHVVSRAATAGPDAKFSCIFNFSAAVPISTLSLPDALPIFTVAAWFRWTTNPSPYYSGIQGGGGSWELRVRARGGQDTSVLQSRSHDVFRGLPDQIEENDSDWHHEAHVLPSGVVCH